MSMVLIAVASSWKFPNLLSYFNKKTGRVWALSSFIEVKRHDWLHCGDAVSLPGAIRAIAAVRLYSGSGREL